MSLLSTATNVMADQVLSRPPALDAALDAVLAVEPAAEIPDPLPNPLPAAALGPEPAPALAAVDEVKTFWAISCLPAVNLFHFCVIGYPLVFSFRVLVRVFFLWLVYLFPSFGSLFLAVT